MLESRPRLCLLAVSIVCIVSMAGCARPFPERLNWYGHHPALYSLALGAAAQEALVRSMTGKGYYEYMGDAAYTLVTTGICNKATLDTYLVRKERGCHLIGPPPIPDCQNVDSCAAYHYDVDLFSDPVLRQVVTAALQRPCDYLTPPAQVTHWDATANFGMAAISNWRILQCDGKQVFATSIVFDETDSILRVRFARGR